MTSVSGHFSRQFLWIGVACTVMLGATAAAWYFYGKSDSPPAPLGAQPDPQNPLSAVDPRIAYVGPYRNIHPDIATVGSAKCAECHKSIAETYSRHPMGMSILPISQQPIGGLPDKAQTTFAALGSQFRLEHSGNRLFSFETRSGRGGEQLYEMKIESNYAIGSGTKGHSFLTERDGFVTQSPVSWYAEKHFWDGSPGFPPELHAGRLISHDCLHCHANEVVPVKGTLNRYEQPLFQHGQAIGCERCHGPGAEHVRLREANAISAAELPDHSIVNPGRLEPSLREAVCQQCHLEGEARIVRLGGSPTDYRPGLPLDAAIRVIVRDHRGEDRKAVNHVEQMYLSKCFTKSGGALGCITCHDPHEKAAPEKRAERYRTACLKCHDCSSPVAERVKLGPPDNCIGCHMPRFAASDIVHAASTDHRIVRTPEQAKSKDIAPRAGTRPFLFFPSRQPDLLNGREGRDFALGFVELALKGKASGIEGARTALSLLERAIADNPNDFRAWEAKSFILQYAGRKSDALEAAQKVLTIVPDYELGLIQVATLAADSNRLEDAQRCWEQVAAINPMNAMYRQELAATLAKRGDWTAARRVAEEAIQLDPALAVARAIVAIAELRAGNRSKADELFQTIVSLNPANLNQLRKWYESERARP
jgi:Flp pilus assembly protein TadD